MMRRKKIIATAALTGLAVVIFGVAGVAQIFISPESFRRISAMWMGAEYLGTEGVVMQTRRNNCGSAALKMVFDHFDIPSTIVQIDTSLGLSVRGASMLSLKELAEKKGLGVEGWKYTIGDFVKAPMPAIVFVHGDHFAVADSVTSDGYIILSDPALGKLRMTLGSFQKIWKGETLVFNKPDSDEAK
ncbi:MAG: cysteine peptidase family C39 domain-containing protein [Bacteroidota bacterium]